MFLIIISVDVGSGILMGIYVIIAEELVLKHLTSNAVS
jgi:hypothetical protein